MNLKAILGNNIKQYRQLKGYSQEEFSEKLGISQQTLSRIERGINFVTSETLTRIPQILGVNLYELFMFEDDYTSDDIVTDIERHLALLKSNPEKLACIRKIVKEITFL